MWDRYIVRNCGPLHRALIGNADRPGLAESVSNHTCEDESKMQDEYRLVNFRGTNVHDLASSQQRRQAPHRDDTIARGHTFRKMLRDMTSKVVPKCLMLLGIYCNTLVSTAIA